MVWSSRASVVETGVSEVHQGPGAETLPTRGRIMPATDLPCHRNSRRTLAMRSGPFMPPTTLTFGPPGYVFVTDSGIIVLE